MTPDILESNVERLLKGRGAEASAAFRERMEARIEGPHPAPRRDVLFFAAAASLIIVSTLWFIAQAPISPPPDGIPTVLPGFDDPVMASRRPLLLGRFLQGGSALSAEVVTVDLNPGFVGLRVTVRYRVTGTIAGPPMKGDLDGLFHFGGDEMALFHDSDCVEGAKRLLIAVPDRPTPTIDWRAQMADTPANRAALALLAGRMKDPEFLERREEVLRRVRSGLPGDRERLLALDEEALPGLYSLPNDEEVGDPARSLIRQIEWKRQPELGDEILDYLREADARVHRPVNSRVDGPRSRQAIELADRILRGPWKTSIDLLIRHLDNSLMAGKGPRRRCDNALTLLIETTDRVTRPFGAQDEDEFNTRERAAWRAWWLQHRDLDPASWCFGLTPAEKADLKRSWLADPGEVERVRDRRDPPLAPDGVELARKLGRRAVPFLLHSILIDPPRATIWREGSVEWNPAALTLLETAAGRRFGDFDLSGDVAADRRNAEVLKRWRDWWQAEPGK